MHDAKGCTLAGASSSTTWALVPENPNELTPATGSFTPAPGQGNASDVTRTGIFGQGKYHEQMNSWLKDHFATPKRHYDRIVRDLITASGKNTDNGTSRSLRDDNKKGNSNSNLELNFGGVHGGWGVFEL